VHRRLVATVLALTATAAASAMGVASASGAAKTPLRYVALGDSYSAASGVLPVDPAAPPNCLRSSLNYPKVLASKISTQLTDVTCGAADTNDYFTAQYQNVPAQLEAVKKDTQLITMTIGGNDSGVFINSILECGAAGATTAGLGSPCKDKYGSSFETTIKKTTYPSLVKALKAVRAKAPKAKVGILSYPWILPTSGGCYPQMPVATGDVPYLRHLQATLNDAVRRAAAATGATYVDLNKVSDGHDACKSIGVRWVEPVVGGTNPVIVHPNALGESKMAEQAIKVLKLS
jgi:lysophospholipase L1-like esterase